MSLAEEALEYMEVKNWGTDAGGPLATLVLAKVAAGQLEAARGRGDGPANRRVPPETVSANNTLLA